MFPAITSEQGPADDVRKDDISHPSIDIIGIFAALAVPVLSGIGLFHLTFVFKIY